MCTRGKTSSSSSPKPLVAHFAGDFVTGHPPSDGNTTETRDSLVKSVFHLHGLPKDIVSDQGAQFTSKI